MKKPGILQELPNVTQRQNEKMLLEKWYRQTMLELDMTERLHFHFSLSCIGEGNDNPLQCFAWRIPGMGSLVGCHLLGRTESDTTEATQQQQQTCSVQHCHKSALCKTHSICEVKCACTRSFLNWAKLNRSGVLLLS